VNLGLLLILAFSGMNVLALCLAGWGSDNKWAILGAARSVAQAVGYEIPLLLAVLAVTFTNGTLESLRDGGKTGAVSMALEFGDPATGLFIYFVCAVAETNRNPFDLPEAESELTAGFIRNTRAWGSGSFFWRNTPT
jgi:NADH-quinone oxidoreductase subunit H